MLPVLRYSLLRFALFTACLGVLYLAGARGLLDLVLAAAVSLALSYVLLAGPRRQVSELLAERTTRRTSPRGRFARGIAEDAALEDAAVDGEEPADHGRNGRLAAGNHHPAHDQREPAGDAAAEGSEGGAASQGQAEA